MTGAGQKTKNAKPRERKNKNDARLGFPLAGRAGTARSPTRDSIKVPLNRLL
jgi:hypothetical protein